MVRSPTQVGSLLVGARSGFAGAQPTNPLRCLGKVSGADMSKKKAKKAIMRVVPATGKLTVIQPDPDDDVIDISPDKVLSSLNKNTLQLPSLPSGPRKKRKYVFKSEETRAKVLAGLKPFPKGFVANPMGRPRRKPFHQAARLIAEGKLDDIRISPEDTVAEAVMKMMAARALSPSQQAVQAAKELADRAEGTPVQIHEHNADGADVVATGIEAILVRFGIQFADHTTEQ